mgnify:FL=1
MHKASAILWDHDNTLMPTAELHFQKHLHICGQYGVTINESYRLRIAANNGLQNWEWLSNDRGLKLNKEKYLTEIDQFYKKQIARLSPSAVILNCIQDISDKDIPQFIVSNARKSSLSLSVESHGFDKVMSGIFAKEDYQGKKNDPSTYPALLEKIRPFAKHDLKENSCVLIDDDADCIDAANEAGLITIHFLTGPNQRKTDKAYISLEDENLLTRHLKDIL